MVAAIVRAAAPLVLAAVSLGSAFADPETAVPTAKTEASLASLHVVYAQTTDDWSSHTAIITIDEAEIHYSDRCEGADFPYKRHWNSDGQLEVFPQDADRACSGKHSAAFLQFYRALRQADAVRQDGDTLVFSWANVPTMRLKRFEPEGLEIRRWVIEEYLDEHGLRAPGRREGDFPDGKRAVLPPPTITFIQGAVTGSFGCGGLEGYYQLDGRSLVIRASVLLLGYCSVSSTLQDDRIEQAFRRVRRCDREGRQMILRGDKGEVEVMLGA